MEKQLEDEREKKAKMDQAVSSKREQAEKNREKLNVIERELRMVANDKMLDGINEEIERLESEMKTRQRELGDALKTQREQNDLEAERAQLRNKEMKLDKKLNKLHENSKIQTEIELLKADKQSKDEQIRKIKLRIKEDCDSFLEEFGEENRNDLNLKGK